MAATDGHMLSCYGTPCTMYVFSVHRFHFCRPQDPLKRANGLPLALMKPVIDAIQKLGRSLWYGVTGGSRACGVPAADII